MGPLSFSSVGSDSGPAAAPENPQSPYKVNVDQGCVIRFTRGGDPGLGFADGMAVYMYYHQPGVFYNDHGKVVPPEIAQAAGYDVEPLLKARRKQLALSEAQRMIEQQYADNKTREVVAEFSEYRVVRIGPDLYQVEFDDGTPMGKPTSEEIAMRTFKALSGYEESKEPQAPPKVRNEKK